MYKKNNVANGERRGDGYVERNGACSKMTGSSRVNINPRLTSVFCNLGSSTFETSSLAVCLSSSSGLYSFVLPHSQQRGISDDIRGASIRRP